VSVGDDVAVASLPVLEVVDDAEEGLDEEEGDDYGAADCVGGVVELYSS